MVDNFQSYALQSRLGIPLLYGLDAVHGNNNVSGAVVFPHNIGMGASRDAALVQQEEDITRQEVLGSGIRWSFAPLCLRGARRPLGADLRELWRGSIRREPAGGGGRHRFPGNLAEHDLGALHREAFRR